MFCQFGTLREISLFSHLFFDVGSVTKRRSQTYMSDSHFVWEVYVNSQVLECHSLIHKKYIKSTYHVQH